MNSLSSSIRLTQLTIGKKQAPRWIGNVCAPSARNSHRSFVVFVFVHLIMLIWTGVASAQNGDGVVAKVDGTPITLRDVDSTSAHKIFSLQQQIFALRKAALENLIVRTILETESARRKISVEAFKNQLLGGPVNVLASQIEELYMENISAFASMSADEAKEKIRLDLEAQARLKRYRDELAKLRKTFDVELFLDEPRLPIPAANDSASIGPSNAEIVITEFSDFQCPYCKKVQSTIKQVLREYDNKIRLEFKHLPLEQHPLATVSAQAAFCSGKQGRFWEYHDVLFSSDDLSREFLNVAASKSGLKLKQFEDCLGSAESRLAIVADLQEAKRLGIDSTPTFLINGKLLRGAVSLDQFKLIIDRELKTLRIGSTSQR